MSKWNKKFFEGFVLSNDVIGFFENPITLKSGRLSCWYVNWRNVSENVSLIDDLADYVIGYINDLGLQPDCFYGVPEGATKLGIVTQYKWVTSFGGVSQILPMGRGNPKEHGAAKDRFFLGVPQGKIVVLEDVTTTGGSVISTIDALSQVDGAEVIAVIGLTNRNEKRDDGKSVSDALLDKKVKYYAMSDSLNLLPKAYKLQNPGEGIKKQVIDYFKTYGTQDIEL